MHCSADQVQTVVGGGPAGLTVANRLSEDPTVNVLVLEAGPADDGAPEDIVPGLIGYNIIVACVCRP